MDPSTLWVLLSAVLVFLMQAGFLCLESGLVRERNAEVVALKNFVDWVLSNLIFFTFGFGLMFGPSVGGVLGAGHFLLDGLSGVSGPIENNEIFFLFQLAFAGTAATIVSGAVAGRASFSAYVGATLIMSLCVYPVFGHWAWGSAFISTNEPWLAELGFRDFAGSTVVHSTGAWFALVAAWKVGPRRGRFAADGTSRPLPAHSYQLAALGALLLWIGWWGFNGGSTLALTPEVGSIILNTNLAGAAAALAALVHGVARQDGRDLASKVLGGSLGGLVAITASCDVASPLSSLTVGAIAGILHNIVFEGLLGRARIDDPVGAFAVHGACGVWGTLAVALVIPSELLSGSRFEFLGVQAIGVLSCAALTGTVAYVSLSVIEHTVGLRLSPDQERNGVDIMGRHRPTGTDLTPLTASDAHNKEEELDEKQLREMMQSLAE